MPRVYKMHLVPTATRYVEGLTAIRPRANDTQIRLLHAHYAAPERTATATELALAARVEGGYPVVNSQYGRLGRLFCEATQFDPDVRPDGTFRWWAVWSLGYTVSRRGFVWVMLPEVAEALEILGWVEPMRFRFTEEITGTEIYREGSVCRILVNAYERNQEARKLCIEYYGTDCYICGFNFGDAYGVVGERFIHVHHLRPISDIGQEYTINPIDDLRPVCPNCHAIIHRRIPAYSIEEVQSFLHNKT